MFVTRRALGGCARGGCARGVHRPYATVEYPGSQGGRYSGKRYTRATESGSGSGSGASWGLLAVPAATFGLGLWQVQRKSEKEELIAALNNRLSEPAVMLPDDFSEIAGMEYRRIKATGQFDHAGEVLLGPRTLLRDAFDGNAGEPGAHVLTPFTLADGMSSLDAAQLALHHCRRILVNRGWVSEVTRPASARLEGQVDGEITIEAIVHTPKPKKPNTFVPDNNPEKGEWYWADLSSLSQTLGTEPVLVEATASSTPPGGFPTGGQSQVVIRNEHMQYIITWFSLSAITLAMWLARHRRGRRFA